VAIECFVASYGSTASAAAAMYPVLSFVKTFTQEKPLKLVFEQWSSRL
jgi:hypothetical protein